MGNKYETKRSWRNLLLNRSVQLRFTLFLCGFALAMMVGLGWWVLRVADEATEVASAQVQSVDCKKLAKAPALPVVPVQAAPSEAAPSEAAPKARERRAVKVKSSMELVPDSENDADKEAGGAVAARADLVASCLAEQGRKLSVLAERRDLIFSTLIGVGGLLLIGLFVWGIKTTHKVAGPLYKIESYLQHVRDGRYEQIHGLRKRDHLMDFYEHFKQAHEGLVRLQREDIDELRNVLLAFGAAGLEERAPEVHALLLELEYLVQDKEKSIVS